MGFFFSCASTRLRLALGPPLASQELPPLPLGCSAVALVWLYVWQDHTILGEEEASCTWSSSHMQSMLDREAAWSKTIYLKPWSQASLEGKTFPSL